MQSRAATTDINALTERIIGAYFNVYNALGYKLLEAVYHRAMKVELAYWGIPFESEVRFALTHRGVNIGNFRADLIVDRTVIVECKAIDALAPVHVAQLRTHLKATKHRTGLLMNFGPEPKVRRVDR